MRVDARSVMIFRLSTTPGTTSCSRPEYRSSVFSRTMTRSTFSKRDRTLREIRDRPKVGVQVERLPQPDVDAGKAFADGRRDRSLQRHFVAADRGNEIVGQRRAVFLEGDHARVVRAPRSPCTPDASTIDTTAAVTSGPMPSPGIRVMVWSCHAARVPSRASQKSSARPPSAIGRGG